jgi:cell division protein FtsW
VNLRRLIPFLDPSVEQWATEARFLNWLTFIWLFIGLTVLYSVSYHVGLVDNGDGLFYFKRQLLGVVLGLIGFTVAVRMPLKRFLTVAPMLFFIVLGLIFLTRFIGTTANGATRWIQIGPFPLQPTEIMKPLLVLQSAQIFARWTRITLQDKLLWLGLFALTLFGILIQPNLSTAALCGITLWLIALAAGLPYFQLGGTALAGVLVAAASISISTYQRRRLVFLNPWADPMQDGYQLIQSLLAVGSGGFWGNGYGQSQQKLSYLPEQHTDFIFSIFSDEFGFVGSVFLILMLVLYSFLALKVAIKTLHPVYRLIAVGAMVFMVGQSFLHIGVAVGILPTTGLPFPLFSYGSNSMISSLVIAGLLIRVARESEESNVVPMVRRAR